MAAFRHILTALDLVGSVFEREVLKMREDLRFLLFAHEVRAVDEPVREALRKIKQLAFFAYPFHGPLFYQNHMKGDGLPQRLL